MRFATFIITFNRPLGLQKVLRGILEQTYPPELVLVVDNGNSENTAHVIQQFAGNRVAHHIMGDNLGPAGAAAYAIKWLAQEEFEWIAWGDDNDPPPFPYTYERLLKIVIEANSKNLGGVGAVGGRWDWHKGEFDRLPDAALHGKIEVDTIGGPHFIQRSDIIHSVGLPDARLFFGFFDPEYCLRIRKAGYRLLVDGDFMWEYREKAGRLNHTMQHRWVSRYPYNSLWQRYYRTRNYIFMMNHTFQHPELARRETLKALGRTVGAWTHGLKYGSAFTRLQLCGIWDGYHGRLGRTVPPITQEGKISK